MDQSRLLTSAVLEWKSGKRQDWGAPGHTQARHQHPPAGQGNASGNGDGQGGIPGTSRRVPGARSTRGTYQASLRGRLGVLRVLGVRRAHADEGQPELAVLAEGLAAGEPQAVPPLPRRQRREVCCRGGSGWGGRGTAGTAVLAPLPPLLVTLGHRSPLWDQDMVTTGGLQAGGWLGWGAEPVRPPRGCVANSTCHPLVSPSLSTPPASPLCPGPLSLRIR